VELVGVLDLIEQRPELAHAAVDCRALRPRERHVEAHGDHARLFFGVAVLAARERFFGFRGGLLPATGARERTREQARRDAAAALADAAADLAIEPRDVGRRIVPSPPARQHGIERRLHVLGGRTPPEPAGDLRQLAAGAGGEVHDPVVAVDRRRELVDPAARLGLVAADEREAPAQRPRRVRLGALMRERALGVEHELFDRGERDLRKVHRGARGTLKRVQDAARAPDGELGQPLDVVPQLDELRAGDDAVLLLREVARGVGFLGLRARGHERVPGGARLGAELRAVDHVLDRRRGGLELRQPLFEPRHVSSRLSAPVRAACRAARAGLR
jgi:hypothetical protein